MESLDFRPLATESLETFKEIEETARSRLAQSNSSHTDSFAAGNTLTGATAYQNLTTIKQSEREAVEKLISEPAIVRLIIEDENGKKRIIYIARNSNLPLPSHTNFASYRSDMGRLAELPLGEDALVKVNEKHQRFYILEKTSYVPKKDSSGWDSTRTIYRHCDRKTLTIESLRDLITTADIDFSDELEQLLAKSSQSEGVTLGISHQVRTAMGLRDQPILDQFQGEIFRLPLDSQMIILGPPGTGKTTTLIKRLGQKIDVDILEDSERKLIESSRDHVPHQSSWLMFTPSDLLKLYLKEAFNREDVPAPDSQIRTWANYRNDVARNTLGILQSSNGGKFKLKAEENYLSEHVIQEPSDWFSTFSHFHENRLRQQLIDGREIVQLAITDDGRTSLRPVLEQAKRWDSQKLISIYTSLEQSESEMKKALDDSKAITDELIRKERNLIFNKDRTVFNRISILQKSLQQIDDADDEDTFDEDSVEDQQRQTQNELQLAVNAYVAAIKSLARNRYLKRSQSKTTRSGKIIESLAENIPSKDTLLNIGRQICLQNGLRRFINSHRRYVLEISQSYLNFRRDNANSIFYKDIKNVRDQISPAELDGIVLLTLKNTRTLITQSFVSRSIESAKYAYLTNITELFRNQIMVDEATDFSMLELACMANLSSIQTNSFFACGDFNQRVTSTGIRSDRQLEWILPNIKKHTVRNVYRQSRALNRFAEALLRLQGGDLSTLGNIPEESNHDGLPPVLAEQLNSEDLVKWLANRIREVEKSVQQATTIAVLVNSKDEVKPMVEKLSANLADINLNAVACGDGNALGEDNDVRVFDVQHIKGLEFEAVFFVGIDALAQQKPDLFDRYLYVGATRAATYLGLACNNKLPLSLEGLRSQFIDRWE